MGVDDEEEKVAWTAIQGEADSTSCLSKADSYGHDAGLANSSGHAADDKWEKLAGTQ
jgi:hypothetical protein